MTLGYLNIETLLMCFNNSILILDEVFFDSMEIVKSFLFLDRLFAMRRYVCRATPWARATKNVKKPQSQCESNLEKLDLKFLQNKTEIFSVTHLIQLYKISFNKQIKLR